MAQPQSGGFAAGTCFGMQYLQLGRIKSGVEFYCHEGGRRVANGIVTEPTGLRYAGDG